MLSDEIKRYKEEHVEGLQEQYGTCRFCGQQTLLQTVNTWKQEDLDEAASEICGCQSSVEYANDKRKKEKAAKTIERKFGEGAEEEARLDANQRELLKKIAYAVVDEAVEKASVTISAYRRQIKVVFSIGSKGGIKIERTITKKAVEEV